MRVLHLGFEHPLMPGAGGGSVRTHEINRRLVSEGMDLTVLTTRFPGSSSGFVDGVWYVPIGLGSGRRRLTRLLGYVLTLPVELMRRHRSAELIVEDFFAPFSSMAVPLWTTRPTLGVVQWLFAREKSQRYRLPLHWIEALGVRSHSRVIAVSRGIAERLSAINPTLHVDVIGNGIDSSLFAAPQTVGDDVLYIGRIETYEKGLDLLLKAWSVSGLPGRARLLLAGTGPDESTVRSLVHDSGVGATVEFLGWVSGDRKRELMASARLVVVPSRMETFGIVAVEALAVGTPVICFDIPCLTEVVPPQCGRVVPAFDVDELASALRKTYDEEDWLASAGVRGREFAESFDWNDLAKRQALIYRSAAGVAE